MKMAQNDHDTRTNARAGTRTSPMKNPASAAMVDVVGLRKSFGGQPVLAGVDLNVAEGEWVALMGPSGCGKTTLLNLVGGLDTPDSGSVTVAGARVDKQSAACRARLRRTHIGIVFQSFNLVPHLDVLANVELPLRLAGERQRNARTRAYGLLQSLDIADLASQSVTTLSGGQQQRVALARALANRPNVLLADEPTGSLDSRSAGVVLDHLRAAHQDGQTILMVTHDHQVAAMADRVVHMRDGRFVSSTSTRDDQRELVDSFDEEFVPVERAASALDRLVRFE